MVGTSISGIGSTTLNRFNKNKSHFETQQGKSVNAESFLNHLLEVYEAGVAIAESPEGRQLAEKLSTNNGGQS